MSANPSPYDIQPTPPPARPWSTGSRPTAGSRDGAFDRQPPQDLTAEQSVLGGMLLSKDAIADVVEVLQPDDFYRPAHQTVYDCILDLYGRGEPADAVTVSAELQRRGELIRLGGAPYLHTLIATVPTAANAAYYAEIVAEKAILRRLVEAGTRIVQLGYHGAVGAVVSDVVDRAQAAIYDVTERSTSEDYVALEELLQPTMDEIDAIASRGGVALGVPTGFADLDAATNGLHAGQMIVVAARPGLGKALALDTPLPTPEGWTTMGDVEVGALLLDAAGRPTKVVAATDVLLERPCFEITFSDGAVLVADAEHQWLTSDGVVRTTRELAAGGSDQAEHAVRLTAALQLPDQDLPLGPYTLGYWLGGGDVDSMSFQMMFAAEADNMAAEGHPVMELPNRRWGFAPPGEGAASVDARLKSIGVLDRPHLPAVYLRGSESQRRALLAGLMDTRGKVTATGEVEFFSTDQTYLDDVRELVVSLGYPCSTPSTNKLSITADENIFRVGWQRDRHRKRSAGGPVEHLRRIVEVRSVPTVPVRCVEVDNTEHLYLAGRSMIPTHNSTLGLDFARSCSVKHGLTSAVFSLEMSKSEIVMRLLSAEARIRLADMRAGRMSDDDWTRMARRMSEISEAPLFIDDSPNLTLMEIRAKARRLKQRNDLKLVILDYLQLMSSGRKVESRQQEVSEFSRQIKLLAKEIEVPVVAISQLNRGPEQRTDKRPMLSDLRESGCLTAGTRLLRADTGAEVAFGDLLASGERDVLLWSLDERMRMVARPMSAVFPSGVKDVFRLRLASGREVEATASHRFLTLDGWCQLGDLAVGDKLATPRRVPAPVTPVPMPDAQVMQLASDVAAGRRRAIPASAFALPDEQVALFLRHLWATAGSVRWDERARTGQIRYASASKQLMADISLLLLRFGALSRTKRVRNGERCDWWHLHIDRSDAQRRFVQLICVHGASSGRDEPVGGHPHDNARTADLDPAPRDVRAQVCTRVAERSRIHLGISAVPESRFCGTTLSKHSLSRFKVAPAAAVLVDADLELLTTNDVFWDEIVEITGIGERPVFDATVPGTHNFIANGVVAHNSIEQDADMVILLHRPDAFERDDPRAGEADLILAKHRNGPTSTITVAHQLHYSRFADLAHG